MAGAETVSNSSLPDSVTFFKHTPSMHKNDDVVTAVFTCPFTQGATDEREAAKF